MPLGRHHERRQSERQLLGGFVMAAQPARDPRFEIASTIWLAMVNDELPDDSTLDLEGYLDAADALLAGPLKPQYDDAAIERAAHAVAHLVNSPTPKDFEDAGLVVLVALRAAGETPWPTR